MKSKKLVLSFLMLTIFSTSTFAAEKTWFEKSQESAVESFWKTAPYLGAIGAGVTAAYSPMLGLIGAVVAPAYLMQKHYKAGQGFEAAAALTLAETLSYTGEFMTLMVAYKMTKKAMSFQADIANFKGQVATAQLDRDTKVAAANAELESYREATAAATPDVVNQAIETIRANCLQQAQEFRDLRDAQTSANSVIDKLRATLKEQAQAQAPK